jgi:LCP family protein required for cell wall assembly
LSDAPPVRDRSLLRSLLAGVLIVLFTAGATATTLFAQLNEYVPPPDPGPPIVDEKDLIPTDPGKPQTLLLLGSDRRWIDKQNGDQARSDTMMLLRLNPDEDATTVMSIPRDLQVEIPGYGTDKMNNAYALGGAALTVRTIRSLTGIRIHHVVNVHFGGFTEAVNELGCFYIDVDRRYYHSNEGVPIGQRYAEIDVPAGYQKLCGQDALDYVRFRHLDNDIVRAARQQGFLRAASDQLRHRGLLEPEDHPVTGRAEMPGLPLRLSRVERWLRRPSPTIGQHNDEILDELGVGPDERDRLRAVGIIGETVVGA